MHNQIVKDTLVVHQSSIDGSNYCQPSVIVTVTEPRHRQLKIDVALMLKCCMKTLARIRSREATMVSQDHPAPPPLAAEAPHIAPPCGGATHRSRVVDPDGPPPCLAHRVAGCGLPPRTAFPRVPGPPHRCP